MRRAIKDDKMKCICSLVNAVETAMDERNRRVRRYPNDHRRFRTTPREPRSVRKVGYSLHTGLSTAPPCVLTRAALETPSAPVKSSMTWPSGQRSGAVFSRRRTIMSPTATKPRLHSVEPSARFGTVHVVRMTIWPGQYNSGLASWSIPQFLDLKHWYHHTGLRNCFQNNGCDCKRCAKRAPVSCRKPVTCPEMPRMVVLLGRISGLATNSLEMYETWPIDEQHPDGNQLIVL